MKNMAQNCKFLDPTFVPQIVFVKSKAMFKLKYKDDFGFHYAYFQFVPKSSKNQALQELLDCSYLTNSFLNHLPTKKPHYVSVPLK